MKYMTFNSSCSYAGVANMLEKYNINVEDRQIALEMGLPFLFSFQNAVYCSGPMLQTAEWFNLYLHPRGFHMTEITLPREEVPAFLENVSLAMLGITIFSQNKSGGKHAVVYTGKEKGRLTFLNNKRKESAEPETMDFSHNELMQRLDSFVTLATLRPVSPLAVDLKPYFQNSVVILEQLKQDIRIFCSKKQTPAALRAAQNSLFRAILLDGVTMLGLLENVEPRETLKSIQKDFLAAVREQQALTLADRIPMADFKQAIDDYIKLIPHDTALP